MMKLVAHVYIETETKLTLFKVIIINTTAIWFMVYVSCMDTKIHFFHDFSIISRKSCWGDI